MHLRPADFFTSNPALDVPSTQNMSSVLVSCHSSNGTAGKQASVQQDPASHMQGALPDVDAREAGAGVEGKGGGGGLTKMMAGLLGRGRDKDAES